MVSYCALFEPDRSEGGFLIRFPDIDWGVSEADTEQEAIEMARDLLITMINDHIKRLQDIPPPKKRRGARYHQIPLPALPSAKIELYRAFLRSGLRKAELARRIGIPKSNLDRLFDLSHASRLEQIEEAFRVLGKRLVIDIQNAA